MYGGKYLRSSFCVFFCVCSYLGYVWCVCVCVCVCAGGDDGVCVCVCVCVCVNMYVCVCVNMCVIVFCGACALHIMRACTDAGENNSSVFLFYSLMTKSLVTKPKKKLI
jgi:hypothetical protein